MILRFSFAGFVDEIFMQLNFTRKHFVFSNGNVPLIRYAVMKQRKHFLLISSVFSLC